MSDYVRRHLGAKLLLSYLAVIVIGVSVLVAAGQFAAPNAFSRHMMDMGQGHGPGMTLAPGASAGVGGGPTGGARPPLYQDFRAGFNEALTYAVLAAMIVAVAVSIFFSRGVVAPLRAVMQASQRIADGRYAERVEVQGSDELAQLAQHFNQMAEKLEQVESMRRQLIADVSHELRTPLTAIGGSMEGLIDGVLPAAPETYQQIHAEAQRLGRLVDDLQELSRVEARAYELNLRHLNLPDVIRTVAKRLGPQFESRGVSLDLDLPTDLPQVLADEDRIVQVLTNLLGNALQYSSIEGRVRLSALRSGEEVQVSVRDSGIGIPPEHLGHVFDRFYRVDKSRSRAGGGSGIGLTIARALVEAHGGRIWAKSEGTGRGSLFVFTLPLAR